MFLKFVFCVKWTLIDDTFLCNAWNMKHEHQMLRIYSNFVAFIACNLLRDSGLSSVIRANHFNSVFTLHFNQYTLLNEEPAHHKKGTECLMIVQCLISHTKIFSNSISLSHSSNKQWKGQKGVWWKKRKNREIPPLCTVAEYNRIHM